MKNQWNEQKARLAFDVLNEHIASLFQVPVRKPDLQFVPVLSEHVSLALDGLVREEKVLGRYVVSKNLIQIVADGKAFWPETMVHELVHYYNPRKSERVVMRLTRETIAALKGNRMSLGVQPQLDQWREAVAGWGKPMES